LPSFVSAALKCLDPPPETRTLKIANLNVLVNAILYNPGTTLQVLEAQGATRRFFEVWFNVINSEAGMPRVHSKRLSILAICELLEMDPAGVPHSLQEGWSGIMAGILKIIRELPGAIEGKLR
jgi:importin-7